jgi:hypothetical protein
MEVKLEGHAVVGDLATTSPNRSWITAMDRLLGVLVEIPVAILVVMEVVILFAGVI